MSHKELILILNQNSETELQEQTRVYFERLDMFPTDGAVLFSNMHCHLSVISDFNIKSKLGNGDWSKSKSSGYLFFEIQEYLIQKLTKYLQIYFGDGRTLLCHMTAICILLVIVETWKLLHNIFRHLKLPYNLFNSSSFPSNLILKCFTPGITYSHLHQKNKLS